MNDKMIKLAEEIQALCEEKMSSTAIEAKAWQLSQMVLEQKDVIEKAKAEQREKDAKICYYVG